MTKTAMIVTGVIIALGIWDLIAVTYLGGVEVSISRFLQNSSLKAPFIPFAFGFIMGHLFWPLAKNDEAALKECEKIKIEREVKEKLEEKE